MHKFLWIIFIFFVKWLYLFRTNDSPKEAESFNEKNKDYSQEFVHLVGLYTLVVVLTTEGASNYRSINAVSNDVSSNDKDGT